MKIVLPGGSGHVGTLLAHMFHARGDEVVVLSRRPAPTPWKTVPWDAVLQGPWVEELEGADGCCVALQTAYVLQSDCSY
jgi:uncharacterized protein YbjT (DUF2867 family)